MSDADTRKTRQGIVPVRLPADEVATDPPTETTTVGDILSSLAADRWTVTVLSGESAGLVTPLGEGETVMGRGTDADIRLLDQGLSRQHARFVRSDDGLRVEDMGSTNGTFVEGEQIAKPTTVEDGTRIQLGSVFMRVQLQNEEEMAAVRRIYESSVKDALTGVYNRRHFEDRLDSEFSFAARHRTSLSLLMIDVDHFKKVNDTYGHAAGDAVLKVMAKFLQDSVRQEDVVARYGGEEFVLVLRDVGPEGAQVLAERIRQGIEGLEVAECDATLRFTASVGVATHAPTRPYVSPSALIDVADKCLYRAKESGRNVVIADASPRSVPPSPGR